MRIASSAACVAAVALAVLRCGGGTAPTPSGGLPTADAGTDGGNPDGGAGGGPPPSRLITIARSGSGSVRSLPPGIDCGAACSFRFPDGTAVSLAAAPASGWKFAGWAGACGGVAVCQVNLRADTTVFATFEALAPTPGHHFLSVARAGTGTGRVVSSPAGIECGSSCGGSFDEGAIVSLTATPDPGSTFSGWSGACSGSGGCSLSMAADRSVTAIFELLPPPDECAELHPPDPGLAPHSAFEMFSSPTGGESCRPGYAAGSGTLALLKDDGTGSATSILFARSSGELLAESSGGHVDLTEQLDGFIAQYFQTAQGGAQQHWLTAFNSSGSPSADTRSTQGFNTSGMLEDPTGGVIAVQPDPTSPVLEAFDAQLRLRWSLLLPKQAAPLRVDRAGNTLVILPPGTAPFPGTFAFWVDHFGVQGKELFPLSAAGPGTALTAAPRVGSGLFIATGGLWTTQIDSLSTTPSPAPAWLAARPVREMHMIHGGRGYAILPPNPGEFGPCTQTIETVAPSGKSCGTTVFPAAPGACTPLSIRVGYDGTVVQQLPATAEKRCANGAQCSCTWHWWPGYFR